MRKLLFALPVLAIVAYAGTKFFVQYRTAKAVDQLIMMASPFATIEYGSVSSTMTGALALDDVSIVFVGYRDPLEIDAVGIKLPSFLDLLYLQDIGPRSSKRDAFPDSVELFIDDALIDSRHDYMRELLRQGQLDVAKAHDGRIPTREEDPLGHCAGRYGISTLDLLELDLEATDVSLRFGMRQLAGEFAIDTMLEIDEFQAFDITARFQGNLTDLSRGRVQRPILMGFEFVSEDQGALQRSLARCETLGVDREAAKTAMLTDLLKDLEEGGFVADDRLIDPLREGFEAEHTWYRITGNPPTPVDLNRVGLYKASDLPALLGVDLESR